MPASNVQTAFQHLVQTLKKCAKLYNVPDDGVSNAMKKLAQLYDVPHNGASNTMKLAFAHKAVPRLCIF